MNKYKLLLGTLALTTAILTPVTTFAYEEESSYYETDVFDKNGENNITYFSVDEFSPGPNRVTVWELWQNENSKVTVDGKEENNPHFVATALKNDSDLDFGFNARNTSFNYDSGQKDTEGRIVFHHEYVNSLKEYHYSDGDGQDANFDYLRANIKQYGNMDDFYLVKSEFYLEDGDYQFTRLVSKDKMRSNQDDPISQYQEYVVVPLDGQTSPFIQNGYTESNLDTEWVTLSNGDTPLEIYVMRGTSDWCYDNYNTFTNWIGAKEANVALEVSEETVTETEEVPDLTETEFIDDEDVPISVPNIVEQSSGPEPVDKTQQYIKLGVFVGVFLVVIIGTFIGLKIYQKKNEDYL